MGIARRLLRKEVAPLGVRTTLIADNPQLLAAAVAACPDSQSDVHELGNAIEIRLETASIPSSNLSCRIEVEGSRITVTGIDFRGHAEARTRSGVCSIPPRLILEPGALATQLLEPILLFLLARSGRVPFHATGIMIEDCAVLLSGPSGSGKSSLALAAARRGLRVLSDDTVYVQLVPAFRVWGVPGPVHLVMADAPDGNHKQRVRAGRIKAAVILPPDAMQSAADRAVVVMLERANGPTFSPISVEDARAALAKLEPGFDLLPKESAAAAQKLTRDGAWRLKLGPDPDAAIGLLLEELPRWLR